MPGKTFDDEDVARLRTASLVRALDVLCLDMKRDRDFVPRKAEVTERWYVSVGSGVYELLVTGQKWFDAHEGRGGGGAIDLTMHLLKLDFVGAVKRLMAANL